MLVVPLVCLGHVGGQGQPGALQPGPQHVRKTRRCGDFQETSDDDADGPRFAVRGLLQPGHPRLRESGEALRP